MNVLVPRTSALSKAFPAILQRAGTAACFAVDDFGQNLQSPTPAAYARPVGRYSHLVPRSRASSSARLTPGLAGNCFIKEIPKISDPTRESG